MSQKCSVLVGSYLYSHLYQRSTAQECYDFANLYMAYKSSFLVDDCTTHLFLKGPSFAQTFGEDMMD